METDSQTTMDGIEAQAPGGVGLGAPPCSGLDCEPWECIQPIQRGVDATPWLGKIVVSRPDGGGYPHEAGYVRAHPRQSLAEGWFDLVSPRHPDGLLTHTQECYPPGFTGCTLPCCSQNNQAVATEPAPDGSNKQK